MARMEEFLDETSDDFVRRLRAIVGPTEPHGEHLRAEPQRSETNMATGAADPEHATEAVSGEPSRKPLQHREDYSKESEPVRRAAMEQALSDATAGGEAGAKKEAAPAQSRYDLLQKWYEEKRGALDKDRKSQLSALDAEDAQPASRPVDPYGSFRATLGLAGVSLPAPPQGAPKRDTLERRKMLEDYFARQESGMNAEARNLMEAADLDRKASQPQKTGEETDYQKDLVEIRKRDQELRASETERKAREAKAKADAKKAAGDSAKAQAEESHKIPFTDGITYVPRAGTQPTKEEAKEAKDKVALYGQAISGVDELQGALKEWATTRSAAAKNRVTAAVRGASGAFNTAIGQGAMSMDEARAMSEALGSDLLSPSGVMAIIESVTGDDAKAAETITQRSATVRKMLKGFADNYARTHNYESTGGQPAGGQSAASDQSKQKPSPGPGYVRATVKGKSGWFEPKSRMWEPD